MKQGGSPLASFTYGGNGRRATKTAGGTTTSYVYDGAQFLEERPGAGTTKRYIYGLGIDRPLAQGVGSATSYFVADHLGSIVQETDSLGVPILTREYDPWGSPLQGSTTGGYAFTGREWESETNLYYYRARSYDPPAGRFLSEDSVRSHVSPYVYARNNPLTYGDPLGRYPGQRFKTRDAAVLDAFRWMNNADIGGSFLDYEYGGHVCQDDEGCFCTGPVSDYDSGTVKVDRVPCPVGTKHVGEYHTHPNGLLNEPELNPDWQRVDRQYPGYAGYVWLIGKPSLFGVDGRVMKYERGRLDAVGLIKPSR